MKIELEKHSGRYDGWTVKCGDAYEDGLDFGETLGVLARMLLADDPARVLRTPAQHEAFNIALGIKSPEQDQAETKMLTDSRAATDEAIFPNFITHR